MIRQDNGSDYDGAMQLTLPDAASEVHALAYGAEGMVFLGRDYVYKVPAAGSLLAQPLTAGAIPAPVAGSSPNDMVLLARLPALRMPIAGAHLPDIDRSLPGAPRPYRFGIHEGIDMYASTVGVNVAKGTQVLAAADGVVTRADVDYKEASVAQVNAWLDESMAAHMTSAAIQDRLGGRQVWIDHGNGLATRYLHLSGIATGIQAGSTVKAGTLIGYAGNSGTTEAAAGSDSGIHLHFEIRVGNGYLGQWLGPIETRRLLEKLLAGQ